MSSLSPISLVKSPNIWMHLGALLAVTAWGVSFISSRVLMNHGFTPTEVYFIRTLIAYVILLCFCHKKMLSNSLHDEVLFLLCGLSGSSIYFIAENTAMQYTLVSNVSLIVTLAPLLTAILVSTIYRTERLSRGMIIGSVIAFLGVACVIFNTSFSLAIKPLGDMLALSAAFVWALYSLILRKLGPFYTALFITRKTFFYGILTSLPFLLADPETAQLSWKMFLPVEVWANFLFLSVFCSLLAFYLWAWLVNKMGAIKANNYLYISPIVTLIASAIILHEKVTIVGFIGCALILVGVWISDRMSIKRPTRQPG